jgi:hypothetical protein
MGWPIAAMQARFERLASMTAFAELRRWRYAAANFLRRHGHPWRPGTYGRKKHGGPEWLGESPKARDWRAAGYVWLGHHSRLFEKGTAERNAAECIFYFERLKLFRAEIAVTTAAASKADLEKLIWAASRVAWHWSAARFQAAHGRDLAARAKQRAAISPTAARNKDLSAKRRQIIEDEAAKTRCRNPALKSRSAIAELIERRVNARCRERGWLPRRNGRQVDLSRRSIRAQLMKVG